MGLKRIIVELDLRRIAEIAAETVRTTLRTVRHAIEAYRIAAQAKWRGWDEKDIETLAEKLDDNRSYHGGLLRLTEREYRALPELNRRVAAKRQQVVTSPLIVWVQERGLFSAIRKQ